MSRSHSTSDAGVGQDAVTRIFARLTADRDELRAALALCEARLAKLERSADARGEDAPTENDAAKALRLAEEALATAQYALQRARARSE